MKRARSATDKILIVAVGLPVICFSSLYATAWYHRWMAEELLWAARSLHVGVTTQVEYERTLQPFAKHTDRILDGDTKQPLPGAYGITTLPRWIVSSIARLPAPVQGPFWNLSVFEGTVFEVIPTFKDGKLMVIRIAEMQGEGHPFGGFVTIHAGQVRSRFSGDPTETFSGYSGVPMSFEGRVIYTHVDMDDRATSEERRRALNFRFNCFTSFRLCTDGRQLLDPIFTDN
jgi:hypothetical protein